MHTKKALMIGAGNIGRGFIGERLANGGYEIIFADVNMTIINEINRTGSYRVHIMDTRQDVTEISNISGVSSASPEFIKAFQTCSLITTAVGPAILPRIAPALASAIDARRLSGSAEPFNIIACENAIHASSLLKNAVMEHLNQDGILYLEQSGGFPNCAVDRIVPPASFDNILDVAVERYFEWDVEKSGFRGEIPEIPGMTLVDKLDAYLERKLFTLNAGHAICAYLGYHNGIQTIDAAIENPEIFNIVSGAMRESGEALIRKFSFNPDKHAAYIDAILNRFRNPFLGDDVARVGREPIRKLSAQDRLIKPLNSAISYNLDHQNIITGIAAALNYDNPDDKQSREMQALLKQYGVRGTLNRISGLSENSQVAIRIEEACYAM